MNHFLLAAPWFITTYVMVLKAELVGDKSVYTIAALTARYRPSELLFGFVAAFTLKMLAAVYVGETIRYFSPSLVATMSALTFFGTALILWHKKTRELGALSPSIRVKSRGEVVAFTSIFFTEWADPGQLMAAGITASSAMPFVTWIAATLSLATKACLAMAVGVRVRDWMPWRYARYGSICLCLILGTVTLVFPNKENPSEVPQHLFWLHRLQAAPAEPTDKGNTVANPSGNRLVSGR
jgi:putative Ca2+/H+ antiporter (TMEM165/GDT1 family)